MKYLTKQELSQIVELRHELHKHPELSGYEKDTAERLERFISQFSPSEIIRGLGGNGIAFVFGSKGAKPVVMFRADMDALPIEEANDFEHKSIYDGVSHKCGHDGHMAILCGLALYLNNNPIQHGRAVLLFQPEEETGRGVEMILKDPAFLEIEPDFVYALHNLPKYERNSIILSNGNFSSASTGVIIDLKGRSSHAAHPEQGNSPAKLTAELILKLESLPEKTQYFKDFALITIVYAKIGDIAFGTNPGKAQIMATLRTYRNDDMVNMKKSIEDIIQKKAARQNISCSVKYTEEFPATINNLEALGFLEQAAKKLNLQEVWIDKPFKWSEDFGNFAKQYKSALYGLGSGINHPSLHNYDYDFNDEIIETGVGVFVEILESLL